MHFWDIFILGPFSIKFPIVTLKIYHHRRERSYRAKAQLYEAQQKVIDMEETVSDIQGVNVVINLKVQEKIIQNLREDFYIQEVIEVTEETNKTNVEPNESTDISRKCKECDYVAAKNMYMKSHMLKHYKGHKCSKCQKIFNSKNF